MPRDKAGQIGAIAFIQHVVARPVAGRHGAERAGPGGEHPGQWRAVFARLDEAEAIQQDLTDRAEAGERQNDERFKGIAVLGLELQAKEDELQEARTQGKSQSEMLQHNIRGENDARDNLRREMVAKQGKLDELSGQLETLRQILHETQTQRDEARQRVDDLERSSSWRITLPLRRASMMVRRGGGRPDKE